MLIWLIFKLRVFDVVIDNGFEKIKLVICFVQLIIISIIFYGNIF